MAQADTLRSVGANPTDACDLVCKDLLEQVLAAQKAIPGVNLAQVLWKPFCRQFIAILISHIRFFVLTSSAICYFSADA